MNRKRNFNHFTADLSNILAFAKAQKARNRSMLHKNETSGSTTLAGKERFVYIYVRDELFIEGEILWNYNSKLRIIDLINSQEMSSSVQSLESPDPFTMSAVLKAEKKNRKPTRWPQLFLPKENLTEDTQATSLAEEKRYKYSKEV